MPELIFIITQWFIWGYVGFKIGYSEGRYAGQAHMFDSFNQTKETAYKGGWIFPDIEDDFHPLTKHVLHSIKSETEMWEEGSHHLYYPYDVEYDHQADFKIWTSNRVDSRTITHPEKLALPMRERRALHYAYIWWKKNVNKEKRELVEALK